MKKWIFGFLLLVSCSFFIDAQPMYPWNLTLYGGGASFCDDAGCFGPMGYTFGGSFGRAMGERWSFELDGAYGRSTETLPARVDLLTGRIFVPELQRTRIWGGATFLRRFGNPEESRSHFFIALGLVGGYERQREIAPEGIFVPPTKDIGIRGGLSGGAGYNYWFGENWGLRPEARFYAIFGTSDNPISGLRYTVGLIHQF